MINKLNFFVSYEAYDQLGELDEADQLLCRKAEMALSTSYSPYSNFKVATAVRLADGTIFTVGAAYPDAVIESMAVTAYTENFKIEQPVTCCGSCLQVMAEFERRQDKEIEILFYCIDGRILKVKGVKNLLPFVFVEDRLKVNS
jgi:cytidine deaminase